MSRIKAFLVLSALALAVAASAPALLPSAYGQELAANAPTQTVAAAAGENLTAPDKNGPSLAEPPQKKTPPQPKKAEASKPADPGNSAASEEEVERDIMEEALVLLNESQTYWVNGNLEDALEMLDQAYALLLDTNGNPDVARQKPPSAASRIDVGPVKPPRTRIAAITPL